MVTHELMEQQKGDADAEEEKKKSPNEALSKNLCSLYKSLFDLKVWSNIVIISYYCYYIFSVVFNKVMSNISTCDRSATGTSSTFS